MVCYDVFSEFYDRLTENVDYKKISKHIASFIPKGAITIDLGCGTGRLTRIMESMGYSMIGIDNSADMLEIGESQKDSDSDILYINQDISNLNLFGSIKGAISTLDTLNHLEDLSQVEKAIADVSLFMEKDGIFIFDINTEYKYRYILADNAFIYEYDNFFCTWQNDYCEEDKRVDIFLDFFVSEDGSRCKYTRLEQDFSEILITQKCIEELLIKYDFEILDVCDDYSGEPISDKTQRITYVARKKVDQ